MVLPARDRDGAYLSVVQTDLLLEDAEPVENARYVDSTPVPSQQREATENLFGKLVPLLPRRVNTVMDGRVLHQPFKLFGFTLRGIQIHKLSAQGPDVIGLDVG